MDAVGLCRHEFAIYEYNYKLTINFHIWLFCDVTDRLLPYYRAIYEYNYKLTIHFHKWLFSDVTDRILP